MGRFSGRRPNIVLLGLLPSAGSISKAKAILHELHELLYSLLRLIFPESALLGRSLAL